MQVNGKITSGKSQCVAKVPSTELLDLQPLLQQFGKFGPNDYPLILVV